MRVEKAVEAWEIYESLTFPDRAAERRFFFNAGRQAQREEQGVDKLEELSRFLSTRMERFKAEIEDTRRAADAYAEALSGCYTQPKPAPPGTKAYYGYGGALLVDRALESHTLADAENSGFFLPLCPSSKKVFFVAESMSKETARLLADALGAEFVETP